MDKTNSAKALGHQRTGKEAGWAGAEGARAEWAECAKRQAVVVWHPGHGQDVMRCESLGRS